MLYLNPGVQGVASLGNPKIDLNPKPKTLLWDHILGTQGSRGMPPKPITCPVRESTKKKLMFNKPQTGGDLPSSSVRISVSLQV